MMKLITIFLLTIFVGCAQVHSGNRAFQVNSSGDALLDERGQNIKENLIVSGLENSQLSSRNFGVIDFTFENITDRWIRIDSIKVYFKEGKANKNIVFTSGKDLSIWYKSTQKKLLIQKHNRQMAMAVIAGLGAGLAIASDNENLQTAGTALVATAGVSMSIDALNKTLDKIQTSGIFPEDHLYAGDFFIPPGLFTRKWILLNSKNHKEVGYLKNIYVDYRADDGIMKTIKLPFRSSMRVRKGWQYDVAPKPN